MSAAEALNLKANLPLAEHLKQLIADKGWTRTQFQTQVYGLSPNTGNPLGGSQVYDFLTGKRRPPDSLLHRWAPHLGVDVESLKALRGPPQRGAYALKSAEKRALDHNEYRPPIKIKGIPSATEVMRTLPAPATADVAEPPQFSLIVGQDGLATLQLNLRNLSAGKAMKAMAALTAAGLLESAE